MNMEFTEDESSILSTSKITELGNLPAFFIEGKIVMAYGHYVPQFHIRNFGINEKQTASALPFFNFRIN